MFNNIFLDSLIGLALILIVLIENIIFNRNKTFPLQMIEIIIIGCISLFFSWVCIFYTILSILILSIINYKNKYVYEKAHLDYSKNIYSVRGILNKIKKPSNDKHSIVVGSVMPVNHTELKYNMKKVEMNDVILSAGTLVTGSTGSGKTSILKSIIKQTIANGKPVAFFDYKGEADILDDLQEYCNKNNIPYYEFSNRICNFSYDPLVNLNETGKVEALMNTRRWDASGADEHYKTSTQLSIQNLIRKYDIERKKNNDTRNYIVGLYDFTLTYKPEIKERDGFNTISKQLEIILTSRAKDLFIEQHENKFTFENNDKPFVVCFSFISANKALANSLSSFIFQDIMDRGTRHRYDPKLLLCIDEFGTLESSILIKDLLEKGRSGGIQTIFSILDVNQIAMNAGEYFVHAILGTINSFLIYAGATQKTAELLAGVQKFGNKDYDIMSLRKPYNGKPPTCLFVTKYNVLSKHTSQEVYRIIPYVYKESDKKLLVKEEDEPVIEVSKPEEVEVPEYIPNIEEIEEPIEIKNIDDFL